MVAKHSITNSTKPRRYIPPPLWRHKFASILYQTCLCNSWDASKVASPGQPTEDKIVHIHINYAKVMRLFCGTLVRKAYNRPPDDNPATVKYLNTIAASA
ncbi:hypothetical protein HNY73_011303 [Argiope bruennichi]|uniref:Uncharacterized protein n=1 Tax=Argiope bruennichi TaxID=94029 RepID=A0A8T0F664_ARGBR|nr:hypothetical protein HNY73_011303 [Argiope bruennichi]